MTDGTFFNQWMKYLNMAQHYERALKEIANIPTRSAGNYPEKDWEDALRIATEALNYDDSR